VNGPRPAPHYPRPAPIEGYGKGGFRFAGMSHRGSLLCLPSGIWAWPVMAPDGITVRSLERAFAEAGDIGLLLIGAGRERWTIPDDLFAALHASGLSVEASRTGTAVSTFNILLEEGRRVAAALIAVE
jgi:uncharacterized protein